MPDCCWQPRRRRPSTSNTKVRVARIPFFPCFPSSAFPPSSHLILQPRVHSTHGRGGRRRRRRRRASGQEQSQQPRKGNEGWDERRTEERTAAAATKRRFVRGEGESGRGASRGGREGGGRRRESGSQRGPRPLRRKPAAAAAAASVLVLLATLLFPSEQSAAARRFCIKSVGEWRRHSCRGRSERARDRDKAEDRTSKTTRKLPTYRRSHRNNTSKIAVWVEWKRQKQTHRIEGRGIERF